MAHYADSSFLVSCYITDVNTARATVWLSHAAVPLTFTALHALEVRNAFQLGVFRGLFTAADAKAAWRNVESDLRGGRLIKTAIKWPVAFRAAAQLAGRHSATVGPRSLDILHIAAARSIGSAEFVSFDVRQRSLATAAGLPVAP